MSNLVERLRRKEQLTPGMGSTTVSRNDDGSLKIEQHIWDDGKRLVNPDGPEAADEITRLTAKLAAIEEAAIGQQSMGYILGIIGGNDDGEG